MIPRDYITEWRERAPWSENFQVEQDLIISRALVEIFSDPVLAGALALRGGTALYKLYITPPARYSEDIDLVQVRPGPAGPVMDALRPPPAGSVGRPPYAIGCIRASETRCIFMRRSLCFTRASSPRGLSCSISIINS